MRIAACLSTGKDDWQTPAEIFLPIRARYPFVLDAAANETNHWLPVWFGPGGVQPDARTADWLPWLAEGPVWLNPPYSRGLQEALVRKAAREARGVGTVVCLLPARTDTRLFHEVIYRQPGVTVEFLRGRVKFVNPDGPSGNTAPFPSMVVTFT